MKNVGNSKCPILLTQQLFKVFSVTGYYPGCNSQHSKDINVQDCVEPLDWLQYNVNSTPPNFLGIFACHLEKWPPWPIHSFFMVALYLKQILWSWSTPVPSFMLLHINPQFVHSFHIPAGLVADRKEEHGRQKCH